MKARVKYNIFFFASEQQRATVFITCSSEKITVSHVNMRSYVRVKWYGRVLKQGNYYLVSQLSFKD